MRRLLALLLWLTAVTAQASEMSIKPCPDSPNCVSTAEARFALAPLPFHVDARQTRDELLRVIQAMPRTAIVKAEGAVIHATFTSLVFRFVDDVEFVLDETQRIVHIRSASRVGRYDFGVNRRRVDEIAQLYLRRN